MSILPLVAEADLSGFWPGRKKVDDGICFSVYLLHSRFLHILEWLRMTLLTFLSIRCMRISAIGLEFTKTKLLTFMSSLLKKRCQRGLYVYQLIGFDFAGKRYQGLVKQCENGDHPSNPPEHRARHFPPRCIFKSYFITNESSSLSEHLRRSLIFGCSANNSRSNMPRLPSRHIFLQ
jgi:hypothetical protein